MNDINFSRTHQADEELTLFPVEQDKSDSTNETDLLEITNIAFMEAIFSNVVKDQRPLICSFKGHPGKVSSAKWFGSPWLPGMTVGESQGNNYFTLASFMPDSEGKYRRKKTYFMAQHALMLDDVGTKVSFDRLTLPQSWLIETSDGNFQVGYILETPIEDGETVDRSMKSIIADDLSDPGADGPRARYARLPVGVNGKYDPPFTCRLVEWHPERRYTIKELADGLGLDFSLVPERHRVVDPQNNPGATGVDDRTYIPRREENLVTTNLKEKGHHLKSLGDGKHDIDCPWKQEHTNCEGGGTAYFEPSERFPVGGFVCLHGHCRHRNIRHLLECLGVSRTEAANLPTIRLRRGFIDEIIDYFEQELANSGYFYQRAGIPVQIGTDPGTKEKTIRPLPPSLMVRILSRHVNFERLDGRSKEWVRYDPPYTHCRILCESGAYPHLLVLKGLARQPYLRSDGSLVTEPGYDKGTGLLGLFNKRQFAISDAPSRQEAENALAIINSLLCEFSFKTKYDQAAALSAILTATIRSSLSLAPMILCAAHQISSGKSYLTSIITAFATASSATASAFPSNDEECQKLLLATLLNAPSVLCFDNMNTDILPYKSLCSALTEENITGRILGVSKVATVSTNILMLASGNNIVPSRDMCRRCLPIFLDPDCEIPAARTFKNQPLALVLSRREYFVSLALTVIRAWIVAGRPMTDVRPVATYDEWSVLCRQPLLWLGYPDPAERLFLSMEQDPDRETLGRLLHAWHDCFNTRPIMIREATCKANQELLNVFMDVAGEHDKLNNKRLGRWISRKAGRIVDGLKFERDSSTRSAEAWRVESV